MSYNLADDLPGVRYKVITNITWGAGGNTRTITDPKITTNSQLEYWITGTVPQAGQWALTYSQGSVLITSSSSESSTLPISYFVC